MRKTEEQAQTQASSLAYSSQKGNYWLKVFENNLSSLSNIGTILYVSDISKAPREVEDFFKRNAGKNGEFDLKKVRKSKNTTAFFLPLSGPSGANPKSINDYQNMVAKLKKRSPAIPELDEAGENLCTRFC